MSFMKRLQKKVKKSTLSTFEEMRQKADIIFEAASQEAVNQYAERVLLNGKDQQA